jgi:hypothetical protein
MNVTSLLIITLVLSACAPHSQGLTTDARAENAPSSRRTLEQRLDKLQATLDEVLRQRESEHRAASDYKACTDTCERVYPPSYNEDQDKMNRVFEKRGQCFNQCEKNKPDWLLTPEC